MTAAFYPARQSLKRAAWRAISPLSRPRLTFLMDRQNAVPPYAPGPHMDPDLAARFSEFIEARRAGGATPETSDIDLLFRACGSREFVARVEQPSLVDPYSGWAVAGCTPIRESNSLAHFSWHPVGKRIYSTAPSITGWASARFRSAPRLESGLSLLDPLATNYAHFLDVIINRVRLGDALGLGDVPLLLGAHVAGTGVCRAILAGHPEIAARVVLVREPTVVEKLYLVRASFDAKENCEYARSLLPAVTPGGDERLLLVRRKGADGRGFTNEAAVVEACRRFGYMPYDPADDPPGAQVARFAGASHVVSAHGAGLANIMFRGGAPLSVLEIFHRGIVRDPFFVLSNHYGFRYDAIAGPPPRERMSHRELTTTPFEVDIAELTRKLAEAG